MNPASLPNEQAEEVGRVASPPGSRPTDEAAEGASSPIGFDPSRGDLPGFADADLLARAVRSARARRTRAYHPRWVAVMDVFQLGSTYAHVLCRRFGLNPDEQVRQ